MRLCMLLTFGLLCVAVCACGGTTGGKSPSSAVDVSTGTSSASDTQTSRPPQNDDYIQSYGHEASGADKRAISKLVKNYYAAAAADDGAKACRLIYSTLEEGIPEDYGKPPGPPEWKGKTCAVVMSKVFKHVPGQPAAVLAATRVTGIRLIGNHGFAQLSSSAVPTGEISVQREGKAWKIETLLGRPCTRCSAD